MWYPLAAGIRDILAESEDVSALMNTDSISIGMPVVKPTPDKYPIVWIVRGDLLRVLYTTGVHLDMVWTIDLCIAVRNDQIAPSYAEISALEAAVMKALTVYAGSDVGILDLSIQGMVSDRDTFRPFLGGWWTIEAIYRWRY